jgi:tetratricopeptide (TPR) repeat protein
VRLIDAKSDRPVWVEDFSRNSTNFLTIEGELAQAIANQLSLTSSLETQTHLARRAAINEEAEVLYLQGMLNVYSASCDKAIPYFQKAIEMDAKFANAYAALAHCYGQLGVTGGMPSAEAFAAQKNNAEHAVHLDDTLAEGHAEMADALIDMKWDWKGAEKEFDHALLLNPNSASTHEQYANYLSVTGNASAAIEQGQIAVKLDPLSGRVLRNLAYIYYFSHQYDQALSLLQLVESKYLTLPPDIFVYGEVYAEKGRYQESINEFLKLGDNPHALGHLGSAYARVGKTASAREIIAQLEKHVQWDRLGAYEIALIYTGLRENTSAFLWLDKAIENHETGLLFVKVEPLLDPLRADPRFDQLLLRVGLANVRAGGPHAPRNER